MRQVIDKLINKEVTTKMGKKPTKHQRDVARARANKAARSKPTDDYKRPTNFPSLVDAITYAKKGVYSLTRIREINGRTFAVTIGTAFLVSPNKLMTCSHVLKTIEPGITQATHPMAFHIDGDEYYLLNKDPYDQAHYHTFTGKLDKNIHLYPAVDAAIITVGDEFYSVGKKLLQHRDVFLKLSAGAHPLGTKVVVMGYPEEKDDQQRAGVFIEQGTNELNDDLIVKRVDRGVINARYTDRRDKVVKYDFTMAFNPGNSGGPIIEEDGSVVAIVHGYRTFPIKIIEEKFNKTLPNGKNQSMTIPVTLKANYSMGVSTDNFEAIVKEHKLQTN